MRIYTFCMYLPFIIGIFLIFRQGTEMRHNKSLGIILSFKNLVLQKVKRDNTGIYTCGASNAEGTSQSNSFTLNVHCELFLIL